MQIHVVLEDRSEVAHLAAVTPVLRRYLGIITVPEPPAVGDILEMPPKDPPAPARHQRVEVVARAWVMPRIGASVLRVLVRPNFTTWHLADTWEER